MNCPECEKLKKRLEETEEALTKKANQLLMIRRVLESQGLEKVKEAGK